MINERLVYEIISLYEYVAVFGLGFLAIAGKNSFVLVLLLALISKQIPEKLLKFYGNKHLEKLLNYPVNSRPAGAFNCNMLNQGGNAEQNPGFPSGHSTVASFLFFVVLFQSLRIKSADKKSIINLVGLTSIFLVLVPLARVKIGCHTIQQVLGGVALGFIWAWLFSKLDEQLAKSSERYREDRDKAFSYFLK
jgi:membrane-associated phospholipid phosphatase